MTRNQSNKTQTPKPDNEPEDILKQAQTHQNGASETDNEPEDSDLEGTQGDETAPDAKNEPVDNASAKTDELGDLGAKDPSAKQIRKQRKGVEQTYDPTQEDGQPRPEKPIDDPEGPGTRLNHMQIAGLAATQDDVNGFFQELIRADRVENIYAAEQELVRLGHFIDPKHDKDGKPLV